MFLYPYMNNITTKLVQVISADMLACIQLQKKKHNEERPFMILIFLLIS